MTLDLDALEAKWKQPPTAEDEVEFLYKQLRALIARVRELGAERDAVRRAARQQALEEAARVADGYRTEPIAQQRPQYPTVDQGRECWVFTVDNASRIASAIRALAAEDERPVGTEDRR